MPHSGLVAVRFDADVAFFTQPFARQVSDDGLMEKVKTGDLFAKTPEIH